LQRECGRAASGSLTTARQVSNRDQHSAIMSAQTIRTPVDRGSLPTDRFVDRARRWLDANLFPDEPQPPRNTRRRVVIVAGLAIAAVGIQLLRMWPSAPLNSIWAEDGSLWLPDAMHKSFSDALTAPHNGYLQTISRLVAEPIAKLPATSFAWALALTGATIVTGCAFVVWRASAGHVRSAYMRGFLATFVVLLPVVGVETLDNVTNSIWFLLFASFWLLLWRPATSGGVVAACVLLFLTAVSNGEVVFLLPMWLLRACSIRDRRDVAIVTAFASGAAVQLAVSWNYMNLAGEPGSILRYYPHWDWHLLPAYAQRIIGGALTGATITGYLWRHIGTPVEIVLGVGLIALVVVVFLFGNRRVRVLVLLTTALSLAAFLVTGYLRWFIGYGSRRIPSSGSLFLWHHGIANAGVAHYMVFPTLLLLTALVLFLDARPDSVSPTTWKRVQAGSVLFLLITALASFNVADHSRGSPGWLQALNDARSECLRDHARVAQVPIAPQAFPYGFVMPLPCSRVA
jgi:hypothetical protein